MADSGTVWQRLTLMRHAEAGLPPLGGSDHARQLTEKGLLQARNVGQRLARGGQTPQQVLCSDAERALQTARNVLAGSGVRAPMLVLPDLYDSTMETILEILGTQADPLAAHVLLVAHNPGIAQTATHLAGGAANEGFPPGTAASFAILGDQWQNLGPKKARLERVLYPDGYS